VDCNGAPPGEVASMPEHALLVMVTQSDMIAGKVSRARFGHFETVAFSNGILLSGHSGSPVVLSGGSRYS
jgi:hypothetical protein